MVGREVDRQHVLSLHFCLLRFRLMVGCEVDGPLWVVLGHFRALCGWSWDGLRASVGGLKQLLGPLLVVLGRSWVYVGCLGMLLGLCGRSWVALGPSVGGLGPLLEPSLAILGCSWGLCWRSRAALGASVGGPVPSRGLCWRSWAALGASVCGPWGSGAEKWPKPEREQAPKRKSGPSPSRNTVEKGSTREPPRTPERTREHPGVGT